MVQRVPSVTVGELLSRMADLDFVLVAGVQGLGRAIRQKTVQRLGVALTGSTAHTEPDRIQLLGQSEDGYLSSQPPERRLALLGAVAEVGFPALVMTAGRQPSSEVIDLSNESGFALITTHLGSTEATHRLNLQLGRSLALQESRHGVLVDVYGVGILLLGKSGIGKSELALELLANGHRLVADDAVLLLQEARESVVGSSPELTRHHIEIRGLGILNVIDLFGAAAVRDRKRVELVIELVEWDPEADYDRLGLDDLHIDLAGVPVRHIVLPVRSGRSLGLIIEVAARNLLTQMRGTHSARAFARRLKQHLEGPFEAPAASLDREEAGSE